MGAGAGMLRGAAAAAALGVGFAAGTRLERAYVRRAFRADAAAEEFVGELHGTRVPVRTDDDVALHVEVDEPDDPACGDLTVIFSHGYALNLDSWYFVRRDLRGSARLVLWDQRSHGRSARGPVTGHAIDQLGRDLARVVEATAPTGPIVLVGHSMGGMTIMALAAQRPDLFGERVRAVALVATSAGELASVPLLLPKTASRAVHRRSQAIAALLVAQQARIERGRARTTDLDYLFTKRLSFGSNVSPAQVQFIADLLGSTPIEVIAEYLPQFDQHDKAAALDVLDDVRTLVLVGDTDALTPTAHSREIARRVPSAELVIVPATGHMIITERHRQVTEHLAALIAAVRADSAGE